MNKPATTKNKQEIQAVRGPVDKGMDENITSDDFALPRLDMIQKMSPEHEEDPNVFKVGLLINTITKETYESANIIPVYVSKNWIRWRDKDEGGGIIWKSDNPQDPRVIEESQWRGTEKPLCKTYINVLCIVEGDMNPVVISFHDTSFKIGKQFITAIQLRKGSIYDSKYRISTRKETNSKGSFQVYSFTPVGPSSDEERQYAMELKETFAGRELNIDNEQPDVSPDCDDVEDAEALTDEF